MTMHLTPEALPAEVLRVLTELLEVDLAAIPPRQVQGLAVGFREWGREVIRHTPGSDVGLAVNGAVARAAGYLETLGVERVGRRHVLRELFRSQLERGIAAAREWAG